MVTIAPFGSWESPVSAADTVAGIVKFSEIRHDGDSLYWLEARPSEGGRVVLVRRTPDGEIEDLLPNTANVRTMAHEYGGGAYLVHDGEVIHSEFADQRLYRTRPGEEAVPITPVPDRPKALRYADAAVLPDGSLVCVRETHPPYGEAINELISIDPDGAITIVASGADFYSSPRVSPGGDRLAWIEWDHPNMPWDGTRLVTAPVADTTERIVVAGGPEESIVQPEWAPDGSLVFVSDRTGWWNLYRFAGRSVKPVHPMEAEFGGPAWLFGFTWYGFLSGGRIAATFWESGLHHLGIIDGDGNLERIDLDYSGYGTYLHTDGDDTIWFVGSHVERPTALVRYDAATGVETVVRANPASVGAAYIPVPRTVSFPTTGGDVAHAVFYPPANSEFDAPEGELPPLLVHIHGGPTANVYPSFNLQTIFWTSRGFAVVDVNYRGSTGFGKAYREKLEGEWGVVDVDDAVAAAAFLASAGDADGKRLAISGGSAGGYTTLAALAFRDTFSAGASHYGIADIEMLMGDSHKFESRYETRLLGTDPEVWRARSPIHSVDRIDVPVALFQGLEDKVVPPNQARLIARALMERGVPCVHVEYEGEGHGFRKAANVIHSLETELAFYGAVFGFVPDGDLPQVAWGGGRSGDGGPMLP